MEWSPGYRSALFDHGHHLNSGDGLRSRHEGFKAEHGPCPLPDPSVILLHNIIEVFHLPELDVSGVFVIESPEAGSVCS